MLIFCHFFVENTRRTTCVVGVCISVHKICVYVIINFTFFLAKRLLLEAPTRVSRSMSAYDHHDEEERPILLNLDFGNPKSSVYSIMASKSGKNLVNRKVVPVNKPEASHANSRVVDRDGPFNQSRGRMKISKVIRQRDLALLYADDLFHTLVDAPTSRCIGLLLVAYITVVFVYAVLYIFYGEVFGCNLDVDSFMDAYFFSLETMATIGYGTSDIFFDGCIGLAVILTSQICVKIIADALVIGVIYSRISRPNKRAATVVFTKHAVIKRIRGRLYFTFRVCELRKHQLVDAHIRLYAIRHERDCEAGE
jgi:hypothetical protein